MHAVGICKINCNEFCLLQIDITPFHQCCYENIIFHERYLKDVTHVETCTPISRGECEAIFMLVALHDLGSWLTMKYRLMSYWMKDTSDTSIHHQVTMLILRPSDYMRSV